MAFTIDMNRFKTVTGTGDPAQAVEKPMTYEERLLGDLPARIAKANELISSGVDPQAGLKELDFVDSWVKDAKNAQALGTILSDKSTDPRAVILKNAAAQIYARPGFDVLRAKADMSSRPKTFAVSILQDIPAARRKAEAILASGDIDNGKIAMEEVRSLVEKNSGMSGMLLEYTGSNPLLKKAQEIMMDTDWESRVAALTDPATNPRSVEFKMRQTGGGVEETAFAKNSVYGSPEDKRLATAALTAFGRGSQLAAPRPAADGQPAQQPVYDPEAGLGYLRKAMGTGGDAVDFGDLHVTQTAQKLFSAGDADTGGAGMAFAVDATRKARASRGGAADPALDRDTFIGAAEVYATAIGGADTADKKRVAGETFLSLTAGMKPGEEPAAGKQAAMAVSSAFQSLKPYADLGYNADNSAKALAGVMYKKTRGIELSPQEAAVEKTFATVSKFKAGVKARLRTEADVNQKGQPEDSGLYVGFDRFNSGVTQMLNAVAGEALQNGEQLDDTMIRRKLADPEGVAVRQLTGTIRSLDPMSDGPTARTAAIFLADVIGSTGQIDAAKLGTYVQAAQQAAGRNTAALATSQDLPAGQAAKKDLAAATDNFLASANPESPDAKFMAASKGMDLRDSAWYSLSSWDLAAGGKGANVMREKLRESWAGAPVAQVFSGNPRVTDFIKGVKTSDLADEASRASVNRKVSDIVLASLMESSGAVRSASSDAATMARLRKVADMYADTYTVRVRDEIRGERRRTVGETMPDDLLRSVAPDSISDTPLSKAGKAEVVTGAIGTAVTSPVLAGAAISEAIRRTSEGTANRSVGASRFLGFENTGLPARIEDRLADALIPPGSETEAARTFLSNVSKGVASGFAAPVSGLTDQEAVAAKAVTLGKSQAEVNALADTLKRVYDRVQKPLTDKTTLDLGNRILLAASATGSGINPLVAKDYQATFYDEAESMGQEAAFLRAGQRLTAARAKYTEDLKKLSEDKLRSTLAIREEFKPDGKL